VVAGLERLSRGSEHRLVAGAADLKENLALVLELNLLGVESPGHEHEAVHGEQLIARKPLERLRIVGRLHHLRCLSVEDGFHRGSNYSIRAGWYMLDAMSTQTVRL